MRMTGLTSIIAASAIALTVGACQWKKVPSHVVATPVKVERVIAAPKATLESLDIRLKLVEDRNARIDKLVARNHAKARVAQ